MRTIAFTSKANTLKFLKKKITKSKIEQIYDFTTEEWEKNEVKILNDVIALFNSSPVIVRSSAVGEDTVEKSEAGNFTSVLNVWGNTTVTLQLYDKDQNIDYPNYK